jgi:predicted acylesterase/phospholipase RssA
VKRPVCLVLPGSGTRLPSLVGAIEVLAEHYDIAAVAGTSGGGVVALAYALGLTPPQMRALMQDVLCRKDLLDRGAFWERTGLALYRGRKAHQLLLETFGERSIGEAEVPVRVAVGDLWTRRARLIDWRRHNDVRAADLARCTMAINGFFDPWRLRPGDARVFCDGGVGLNVPAAAWDDHVDLPTIVVRFSDQQPVHTLADLLSDEHPVVSPVRANDPLALAGATADLLLDASAAAFPSRKSEVMELVIESDADGLAFGLKPSEVDRRRKHGILAAQRFIYGTRLDQGLS